MSNEAQPITIMRMYEPRQHIYVRSVKGWYASWRWACVWITQLVFYGLPWFSWNGRQAVLFDLSARKFYLFGLVLWPQDLIYLALLLIIAAFALFLFTAVAGRVWCGFACPQTVYTEIFLWLERKIEGERSAHLRRDRQPLSAEKAIRKTAKHMAWGAVALWTGYTFVGYFTAIDVLSSEIASLSLGSWEWFWVLFYALATYGNAGWLREQVCRHMCPYARFQGSMFDADTLIVSYDRSRGEPRHPLQKIGEVKPAIGSCIDCSMCVQVCPTGIDIRNGLQFDCIGCAACVDACDSVMDKIGAPHGLIRFTTENALINKLSSSQMWQRIARPRVLIYSAVFALLIATFFATLAARTPLIMDVIRDRGTMAREVEDGMIENVYRLQIMNATEETRRYRIAVEGIEGVHLTGTAVMEVDVPPAAVRSVPVTVRIPQGQGNPGANRIFFGLRDLYEPEIAVREKATFFVPR